MACLFLDSCAAYASNADALTGGWNATTSVSSTGGRWGVGNISVGGGECARTIASGISSGAVGFVMTSGNFGTTPFFNLRESAGGPTHLYLKYVSSTDTRVELRNGAGTLLGTSTTTIKYNSVQHCIEVKFNIHDTTGSAEVWFEGVKEIDVSNVDTKNGGSGTVSNFMWIIASGGLAFQLSEVYINDTTGSAPNNATWAESGGYRISPRRATGAGNYAQWTPSASTNVSNIDDANGNDGDSTYNSSSTANQKDTFQFGAIPSTTGTVAAIMHRIVARKDDAGTRTIRPIQRQTSDYSGTTTGNLLTSYAHYTEVKEINPATSVAYTVSEMRSTTPEFGYEIVS